MIISRTKRKIIIKKIAIEKLERFKTFEIKLSANVKKVTGIAVTLTAK
jgi:hypothetical protein